VHGNLALVILNLILYLIHSFHLLKLWLLVKLFKLGQYLLMIKQGFSFFEGVLFFMILHLLVIKSSFFFSSFFLLKLFLIMNCNCIPNAKLWFYSKRSRVNRYTFSIRRSGNGVKIYWGLPSKSRSIKSLILLIVHTKLPLYKISSSLHHASVLLLR
jgi:hypothetical protein